MMLWSLPAVRHPAFTKTKQFMFAFFRQNIPIVLQSNK